MNRTVTCGLPVAKVISGVLGTTAFGKGLPKGTKVLTSCSMLRSMSTILPICKQRQRGFGLSLELGEVALAKRWRGGQWPAVSRSRR